MKLTSIACVVIASLSFGAVAQAGDRDGRGSEEDMQRGRQHGHNDHRDRGGRGDQNDYRFDRRDERWNDRQDHYNARGQEFSRGRTMPYEYRRPEYVVIDYSRHRLPPPPRNHQWVQVGADYVLVAIATGIIAQIILNQ
jgi:Ni/Co efflux regulator RcnB